MAALLLTGLTACQSKQARELDTSIDQKERAAFHILVGKDGLESKKLDCLIKKDFDGARQAVDREEQAFNQIILEIKHLPAEDLQHGDELKTAAAAYYTAIRDLQVFDRQEIVQRQISHGSDTAKIRQAQDEMLRLSREKLKMYDRVHEQEVLFSGIREKFRKAHDL